MKNYKHLYIHIITIKINSCVETMTPREELDDFRRPEELEITRYTRRGYDSSRLAEILHLVRNERLFEYVVKEGLNEQRMLRIIDDIIFLKHLMIVKGCSHQCSFCGQNPLLKVEQIYEQDFMHIVNVFERFVAAAGIPQYHALSDISFHRDGESLMYAGKKSPQDEGNGDLAAMMLRVKESRLFDRTKDKADRIRICTAGVFDRDEGKTITGAIKKMMSDIDRYFGTDKKTGSRGGIRFSFHTGTAYLKKSGHLGISPDDWVRILIDNFVLFKPLFDDGRFGIRIKEAEDTGHNLAKMHGYTTAEMWKLLWKVWKEAGYCELEEAKAKNPKVILSRKITASGRGRTFDGAVPYEGCEPTYVAGMDRLRRGVPVVYFQPDGRLVREVPKTMRGPDKRKNIIRETELSLPSRWKRLH